MLERARGFKSPSPRSNSRYHRHPFLTAEQARNSMDIRRGMVRWVANPEGAERPKLMTHFDNGLSIRFLETSHTVHYFLLYTEGR